MLSLGKTFLSIQCRKFAFETLGLMSVHRIFSVFFRSTLALMTNVKETIHRAVFFSSFQIKLAGRSTEFSSGVGAYYPAP